MGPPLEEHMHSGRGGIREGAGRPEVESRQVRLLESLIERAERQAKKEGKKYREIIERILEQYLEL